MLFFNFFEFFCYVFRIFCYALGKNETERDVSHFHFFFFLCVCVGSLVLSGGLVIFSFWVLL